MKWSHGFILGTEVGYRTLSPHWSPKCALRGSTAPIVIITHLVYRNYHVMLDFLCGDGGPSHQPDKAPSHLQLQRRPSGDVVERYTRWRVELVIHGPWTHGKSSGVYFQRVSYVGTSSHRSSLSRRRAGLHVRQNSLWRVK